VKATADVKNWLSDLVAIVQAESDNEVLVEIHLDSGTYTLYVQLESFEPRTLNG
jgi:hypothetical protein